MNINSLDDSKNVDFRLPSGLELELKDDAIAANQIMSDTKLTNCCLDGSIDKIRRDEDMRSSEIICNGTSVRNGEKVVNDVNVDVDVDVDGDVDVDVDVNDVNINGVTINDNCVEGLEEVMNGDLVVSAPVMMKSDNVKKKKKKKRLSLKPTDGRLGGGDNDDNGEMIMIIIIAAATTTTATATTTTAATTRRRLLAMMRLLRMVVRGKVV